MPDRREHHVSVSIGFDNRGHPGEHHARLIDTSPVQAKEWSHSSGTGFGQMDKEHEFHSEHDAVAFFQHVKKYLRNRRIGFPNGGADRRIFNPDTDEDQVVDTTMPRNLRDA